MIRRFPLRAEIFTAIAGIFFLTMVHRLSAAESASLGLPGYEVVAVRYGPGNKMLMTGLVNGHSATFIIDTGAGVSVLERKRARDFGVTPVEPNSQYGQFASLNGKAYRVGYIDKLEAGSMNFGGGPMALFDSDSRFSLSIRSSFGNQKIDGIIGADILTRYQAVINCGTRLIFFKVSSKSPLQLARFALSDHFTQVPLREESSRGFTVPGSINGHALRMLVDTGAPLTTFNQAAAKLLGISASATGASATFSDGAQRQISIGRVKQLKIGDFRLPPQRLATTALPQFAAEHGKVRVDGILGMELLALNHGIIDFGSRSLFLK